MLDAVLNIAGSVLLLAGLVRLDMAVLEMTRV